MFGIPTNEENLKKHVGLLHSRLDAYEVILSKSKYLAGDVCANTPHSSSVVNLDSWIYQEITLADIFHLPYGYVVSNAGFADLLANEKRPNVTR